MWNFIYTALFRNSTISFFRLSKFSKCHSRILLIRVTMSFSILCGEGHRRHHFLSHTPRHWLWRWVEREEGYQWRSVTYFVPNVRVFDSAHISKSSVLRYRCHRPVIVSVYCDVHFSTRNLRWNLRKFFSAKLVIFIAVHFTFRYFFMIFL